MLNYYNKKQIKKNVKSKYATLYLKTKTFPGDFNYYDVLLLGMHWDPIFHVSFCLRCTNSFSFLLSGLILGPDSANLYLHADLRETT